ncbi:hypothetical protein SB359474_1726 [Shigella boydii 3594-74]|uniref:Uncharacterized protein n=1 Tax=Shigella boydii 4444-74 TaxID=766140 RepID=I6DMN8_SHIBO|nr:hypothetical protein SB359474_1726 [Shigella boydii 3594-74]EIQ33030.1 hypothetical protein SB444474_4087 [Shigella boydii 4444-74]
MGKGVPVSKNRPVFGAHKSVSGQYTEKRPPPRKRNVSH